MSHTQANDERVVQWDEISTNGWVVISGKVYDISEWTKTHPGGDIIRHVIGRDATIMFDSYHPMSSMEKVFDRLQTRCVKIGRVVMTTSSPRLCEDDDGEQPFYRTLKEKVHAHLEANNISWHGNEAFAIAETVVPTFLFLLLTVYKATHASVLAAVCCGFLIFKLGWIQHQGSHRAQSRFGIINDLAGFTLSLVGSNSTVWQWQHNVTHHLDPNDHPIDADLGDGLLRMHPSLKRYWFHKYQHIALPLLTSLATGLMFAKDFEVFFCQRLACLSFRTTWLETIQIIGTKLMFLILCVIMPWHTLGFRQMTIQLLIILFMTGQLTFNCIISSHIHKGLLPPKHAEWAVKQVCTTANFATSSWLSTFISGAVNLQVEHHLFPTMGVATLFEIAPIVREHCREYGVPYFNFTSFWSAHRSVRNYLRELGEVDHPSELAKNAFDFDGCSSFPAHPDFANTGRCLLLSKKRE